MDIRICTFTVTVTPRATAATMAKKNKAPRIVTGPVCLYSVLEKSRSTLEPAGNVAITMKRRADTMRAQPDR